MGTFGVACCAQAELKCASSWLAPSVIRAEEIDNIVLKVRWVSE